MSISTTCPNCSAFFRLGDDLAGKTVKCQACASMFVVPAGDATGMQAGMLVSIGAPPPPAPPVVLKAADDEGIQEGRSAPPPPPPRSEGPEPRRRDRERAPVKSGSSALQWVLGLGALGLFFCLGCTGVSAVWYVGV